MAAKDDISIGTALVGLQIQSVNVEVGDAVKKGQVLATLESSNVQSQVRQHDANLQRARANLASQQVALAEAETILKRYQMLIEIDAISRQEWEQQQAKAKTARAAVQAANAEIAQVQAQLDDSRHQSQKTQIIAVADGIITQRTAEVGNLTDNNALFHLARNGELEAVVEASADDLSLLKTGLSADIELLNQKISGQIRLISSQIDNTSRTGKVRISLSNPIKATVGTPVLAHIRLPEMSVSNALPLTSINFNADSSAFVMVVKNGTIERRNIVLGNINQGMAEIVSGLKAGEQVVQKAGALVHEGNKVEAIQVKKVEEQGTKS